MRAFTIARNTWRQAMHLPVLHVILIGSVLLLAVVAQLPRFTLVVEDERTRLELRSMPEVIDITGRQTIVRYVETFTPKPE